METTYSPQEHKLYDQNSNFLDGLEETPFNIDEIRFNLIVTNHGIIHTKPLKRILYGFGAYLLSLAFVGMAGFAISVSVEAKQYYMLPVWLFGFTASVYLLMRNALSLLGDRTSDIDRIINKFKNQGKFYIGKILQIDRNSPYQTVIYYSVYLPNNTLSRGKYFVRKPLKHPIKYAVVWYVDDSHHTLL